MSSPVLALDGEVGSRLRACLLGSAGLHLVVGCMFLPLHAPRRSPAVSLGYPGSRQLSTHLEILEPGSLHFDFYQPRRAGTSGGLASRRIEHAHATRLLDPAQSRERRGLPADAGAGVVLAGRRAAPRTPPSGRGHDRSGGAATADGEPAILPPQPALAPDVPFSDELVILKFFKPTYPEEGLEHRITANVLVALHVDLAGDVDEAVVREARADPPTASTRGFELVSLEALKQWKLRLPVRNRNPEGCWLEVPIEFRLAGVDGVQVGPPSLR